MEESQVIESGCLVFRVLNRFLNCQSLLVIIEGFPSFSDLRIAHAYAVESAGFPGFVIYRPEDLERLLVEIHGFLNFSQLQRGGAGGQKGERFDAGLFQRFDERQSLLE